MRPDIGVGNGHHHQPEYQYTGLVALLTPHLPLLALAAPVVEQELIAFTKAVLFQGAIGHVIVQQGVIAPAL